MADYQPERARVRRALLQRGIVVVMNADHIQAPEHMVTTIMKVYEAGYVPEVTFRIDEGILSEGMAELRRRRQIELERGRHLVIGVGSITGDEELDRAVELGFDLLVGPASIVTAGRDPGPRLKALQEAGVAVAPAAFTPAELQYLLHNAIGFEPDAIKIFPARLHGPRGLSDLLAPYARECHRGKIIMPTGGVNDETAAQYVAAIRKRGFVPVLGMSAPLALVKETGRPGDPSVIEASLAEFARRIKSVVEPNAHQVE